MEFISCVTRPIHFFMHERLFKCPEILVSSPTSVSIERCK